jgi:hypothetical protein
MSLKQASTADEETEAMDSPIPAEENIDRSSLPQNVFTRQPQIPVHLVPI